MEEEELIPSLKKRMRGSVPPPQKSPQLTLVQETPRRGSSQGLPSPSISVDDFIHLEALNELIEEDNMQAVRQAEAQREAKHQEEEEMEAAKAESLRLAKEERKRRKAKM